MRVAIDARPAVAPGRTGVGRYTWNLIRHLPRVDPRSTYIAWYPYFRQILSPPRFFGDVAAPNFRERWSRLPGRLFRPAAGMDWLKVDWFVGFDVFFAPNYVPPPIGAKRLVVTVHDLAFRLMPETVKLSDRYLRHVEESVRRAGEVLVVSEATKRDLIELYPVDPGKVTVTPLGVDHDVFRPPSDAEIARVRRRFGIDGPYFLFVGGIEPRKNLDRILQAYERVPEHMDASLVIAGAPVRWSPKGWDLVRPAIQTLAPRRRDAVKLTGYVKEAEAAALLGGCVALVYPSLYEGFGLPVAEAMACGAPVLTSNVSSLPEVAGDAAVLVDPKDVDAIANGMSRLHRDGSLRERLRESGLSRAARFRWEDTAEATAAALRRVSRA